MRRFVIEHSEAEIISNSGLALVGQALHKHTRLTQAVNTTIPHRHGISNADILSSYIGLLCVGKSDCDAIEDMRDSYFFSHALNITTVPSAATLRQRLDKHATAFLPLVE